MRSYIEQYWKHFVLDMGFAAQDIVHFFSHPKVNKKKGIFYQKISSVCLRLKSLLNNLLFAVIPPQFHHSQKELQVLCTASTLSLFKYGLAPWSVKNPMSVIQEND